MEKAPCHYSPGIFVFIKLAGPDFLGHTLFVDPIFAAFRFSVARI